jgi:acyl carrier protein
MTDALIQLFSEILDIPPEKLNDDSSQDNLRKWDSLATVHLVVAIESRFNVNLSNRDAMEMLTIGLARKVLRQKKVDV